MAFEDTGYQQMRDKPLRSLVNFYYDNFVTDISAATVDVTTYYVGAIAIATVTITYSDTSKETIISGVRAIL